MSYMNTKELCELFSKKQNCSFVAVFGSVLQINCANAAMMMLSGRGIKLDGFVFRVVTNTIMQRTYDSNYAKNTEDIEYVDGVESFTYSSNEERYEVFKCALAERNNKDVLYFISADLIHPLYYSLVKTYGKTKRIVYVEVDDGLESYAPRYKNRILNYKIKHQRIDRIGIKDFLRESTKVFSIECLLGTLKKKNNYMDARLLDVRNGMTKNSLISAFFLDAISENYNLSCKDDYVDLKGKIMIVGDWATPIELISNCIDELMSMGYRVIYKPHPRELNRDRLSQIKCEIMEKSDTALEVLLVDENNRPECLIGEHSSVLMYSRPYFGINSISCKTIRQFCEDNLDIKYTKMYKQLFGKVIQFPSSIEQLFECIGNL